MWASLLLSEIALLLSERACFINWLVQPVDILSVATLEGYNSRMGKTHHKAGELQRQPPSGVLAAMKKVLSRSEDTKFTAFEERVLDWFLEDRNAFMAKYIQMESAHRKRTDEIIRQRREAGKSGDRHLIGLVDKWLEEHGVQNGERESGSDEMRRDREAAEG